MENEAKFIYAIVDVDKDYTEKEKTELIEQVKKDNEFEGYNLQNCKVGHLFKIVDNLRFWQFDSDVILFNEDGYYHTGNGQVIKSVENKDIVAIVNEDSEIEFLPK